MHSLAFPSNYTACAIHNRNLKETPEIHPQSPSWGNKTRPNKIHVDISVSKYEAIHHITSLSSYYEVIVWLRSTQSLVEFIGFIPLESVIQA